MKSFIVFVLLLGFSVSHADETKPEGSVDTNALKNWYFQFGMGLASPSYSGNSTIQAFHDQLKAAGASTDLAFSVDVGFYWPVQKQWLLGVSDFALSNRLSNPNNASDSTSNGSISTGGVMASGMYFFNSEIASNWFARLDAGIGTTSTSTGTSYFSQSNVSRGFAYLVAGGYSFEMGQHGARLPVFLGYLDDKVSSGRITAWSATVTFMF